MNGWIVVGAGSAGCVVARRLADAGHEVTVVEAGPGQLPHRMRGASYLDALAEPGRVFPGSFLRGRGLGGSSAVNGMLATAGDVRQYERWGWRDAADAVDRVLVPREPAADDELGPLDRALLAAAPDAERVPLTRRHGRRVTAADAYLDPLPPGVRLRTGARVERLVLDGPRAAGVRLAGGAEIPARAVVLAAGAIGTPVILARSGVAVAGLGEGLRNHPAVPVTITLTESSGSAPDGLVTGTVLRRGDIQLVPLNHLGPSQPGLAMLLVVLMVPEGRGRVEDSPDGEPSVDLALTDGDRRALTEGVALARELLDHPAFRSLVAGVAVGEPPAGVFHATSTCAEGVVVDDRGAVAGYDGLNVVDASVFPDIPATNPYLPTLMLAERLAARLVSTSRRAARPSTGGGGR